MPADMQKRERCSTHHEEPYRYDSTRYECGCPVPQPEQPTARMPGDFTDMLEPVLAMQGVHSESGQVLTEEEILRTVAIEFPNYAEYIQGAWMRTIRRIERMVLERVEKERDEARALHDHHCTVLIGTPREGNLRASTCTPPWRKNSKETS